MFTKEIPYRLCSPLGDILSDLLLAGEAPTPAEVGLLLCHWHQVGCVHCCVYHLVHIIALKVTLFSQHIECSCKKKIKKIITPADPPGPPKVENST